MKKNIISASLYSTYEIEVIYYLDNIDLNTLSFYLLDKDNNKITLSKTFKIDQNIVRFLLTSSKPMSLGNDYLLMTNDGEKSYLDYDEYITSTEFKEKYQYLGDDLGCTYSPKESVFKVYSPIASKVMLKIEKKNNTFILLEMTRTECGVFETTIKGDCLNKKYAYVAKINGVDNEFNDLYGRGTSLNSEYSVVVDLKILNKVKKIKPTTEIHGLKDRIIYEVDIRDFTQGLTKRATYEEFIKKIPYLYYLGVTYVQLLPVLDFDNVNDAKIDSYNWGYDPISFFALEGSYSAKPEDAHSRMLEFKTLVSELHKAGIRVILDVVYNHVYDYLTSDFEKSFPGYYFRKYNNKMCNGSGCGNDFASERIMARKIIIDSLKNLVNLYDVDGFRFDLLGLIDIKTSQELIKELKAIKPDIVLYGEGWDMLTALPREEKSSSNNARQIPEMGFFNAGFRDAIKGETFNKTARGYISGELGNRAGVENALFGSYASYNFVNASQTINYVECHDNQTLYDKLSAIHDDEEAILKRVKFANALTILSLGTPLIHMGQEIGLSKFGLDNTYNVLKVNNMDWKLVKTRQKYVNYVSDLIAVRKKYDIFSIVDRDEIQRTFDIYQHENGLFTIKVIDKKYLYGNKEILFIINPTDKNIPFELDDYYNLYLNTSGIVQQEIFVKNVLCSYASLRILIKK